MATKLILFDIGYTLLFQNREKNYQKYVQSLGYDVALEDVTKAYHISDKQFMRDFKGVFGHDPATFLPWFLGTVNFQLGVRANLVEQFQTLQKWNDEDGLFWQPFPFVKKTLTTLKESGYQLGIISNWDETARPILEQHGLTQFFDPIVISIEFGQSKPSKAIFEHALQLAGIDAAETIYVGDNYYDDVIGASRVGIKTVLLNPFERLGIEEIDYDYVIESIEQLPNFLNSRRITNV